MSSATPAPAARPLARKVAVVVVLALWLAYAALQTALTLGRVGEGLFAVLAFMPGILGVGALLRTGLSRQDCYLRLAPPSWRGLAVLLAVAVFALAAMLPFGLWQRWDWQAALLNAPASGVSQELPTMMMLLPRRPRLALLLHALLFGLWHIGPLFLGAPLGAVLAIMLVPFLCGLGWGWQVRRDATVLWAMVQHSLIWVIGLQFSYG
jgi:membrane protease YdiL (CAAX protease family)